VPAKSFSNGHDSLPWGGQHFVRRYTHQLRLGRERVGGARVSHGVLGFTSEGVMVAHHSLQEGLDLWQADVPTLTNGVA